ncbi:MAG TPA: 50S ribosomal protein L15 [Pseudomonadales bacterium]
MRLNTLRSAPGHKKAAKRVGRGIGSGLGKTCGAGHKGQKSRKSGGIRPGFEGGQMPLQIRLPKFGFTSRISMVSAQIRLGELALVDSDVIDLEALKAAGLVSKGIKRAKVFLSGELTKPVTIKGLAVTAGAKAAIEAAGGRVEE